MSLLELQAQMAPNLAPDRLSWWPPGTGVVLLVMLLLLAGIGGLLWYSWHVPWWHWPTVRRLRRAYLSDLDAIEHASEPGRAISQWLRQLARDGQGVPTQLPPQAFLAAWERTAPVALPPVVRQLMHDIYTQRDVRPLLHQYRPDLEQLCLNCLHLHSPGRG